MSSKEMRERSVKLCQMIYDRQIDSEIGFEIRKLLEEGVLIDFQDQNQNKKTAIHLAVDKGDLICVKFLLQFKPSLEVKDEVEQTPIVLAESKGFQNILNLLLNSTVDLVNESYVEAFHYESITPQKIDAIKLRPSFKILKLVNCPSVNDALNKLNDHEYARAFNESSYLFFIAIETMELQIDDDLELEVLKLRRPMIVQLSSPNRQTSRIYFKDDKDSGFIEISHTTQVTQDEFNEAIKSEDKCNMKLLVTALRSNLFGNCSGDLLDTKLNTNNATNQFAKGNALCHRFFKLFDEGQPHVDRVVATLSFKGGESLLALLDLPFELNDEKLKLTEHQQDILATIDSRGHNLLMMAAELKNLNAIKVLLRCGCDFNYSDIDDKRASDICREVKAFDCLAELIEADSPFPYNFSTNELDESSEAFKRINDLIEAVNSFHVNIEDGEIEDVKEFITDHPHIKHAYDKNNYCALTVALQSDEADIFSLLLSEGFEPGVDDEYYTALDEFKNKNIIRESHKKYFKEAFDEPHLKRLLKMYRLSFGSKDRAKCSTIIRKMFDELNEIDEIVPILKICSTFDQLRIVFDFNCNSVVDMVVETGSKSSGIVYPSEGFVYIGAKNHETEFFKVIGSLVHELTHYAMRLTFVNKCKPYGEADASKSEEFEIVVRETKSICDELPTNDSIVRKVFKYEEKVWHQELIVRVPQLLARYKKNPETLKAAERSFPELFHFYREKTLKFIEARCNVLLQEYLISKINRQTGTARKIENLNVKFKDVESINMKSVIVITSNAPKLTLAMLSQLYSPGSHIFVTLEQVAIGNVLGKLAKLNVQKSATALIIDCIGWTQKYQESVQNFRKKIKNLKVIGLVMATDESALVKEILSKFDFKTYTHKWSELTERTEVNLLKKLVIFQGIEMALNELVEPSSEAMNFFPLGKVLESKDFTIGSTLRQSSHNFYIERRFIKKGQHGNEKTFEELLTGNIEEDVMIISDEAGSGKSVALFEIAKHLKETFPDRWVLFVDLKRHIEAFKGIEDCETIESFDDFIVQNILKNEPEFDQELFKQMFQNGQTFVLFDGIDEISPNFKNLLLFVLKLFQPGSSNQFYITTRPHLEADLENALGNFVFKLQTFSEECQKSFLRKYWQKVAFKSDEEFEALSSRLLEKFSKLSRSNFVGLPLLMHMTAEIFNDPIRENSLEKLDSLSVASIFKEFVRKYLVRWKEEGNEISRNENAEIEMTGGILEIHHNIAVKHKLGGDLINFEIDEGDAEKIARVGLIRYDKTEKTFQFIHEIFAEYFVADFILFHLNRKNQNPMHDCSLAVQVLVEVFGERHFIHGTFDVIKTFLDEILKTTKLSLNEASCQSAAKCFSEVIMSKNCFDVLRESLRGKTENVAILLLPIVKHVEADVLMRVLHSDSVFDGEFHSTALRNAAQHGSGNVVSALCNIITARIDSAAEIFQQSSQSFNNVLYLAAGNKNSGIFTALCKSMDSSLSRDKIGLLLQPKSIQYSNILGKALSWSNDVVVQELLSLLPNYLTNDEMKSFMRYVDSSVDKNCLQLAIASRTNKNVKLLCEFIGRIFGVQEQKLYFQGRCRLQLRNIFHWAAQNENEKIFGTIIESTKGVLSSDDLKSMLMEKDSDRSNVLHVNAQRGNEIVLKELNSLLREHLSDADIRILLLEVSKDGKNCFRLADTNTKMNFQLFRETVGNLLLQEDQARLLKESSREIDIFQLATGVNNTGEDVPTDSIKYLLTKKDYNGRNAFHNAALKDIDTWTAIVSLAQARFSLDEVKSFLFNTSDEGKNSLHWAVACNRSENMIGAIFTTIKAVLSIEDQKLFVQLKDLEEINVFHLASESLFKFLINCLRTILSEDEIKEMIKQKDSCGKNILFHFLYDDEEISKLFTFLPEILSTDEIKILLFDEDCEGQFQYGRIKIDFKGNCLQYAVRFMSISIIKSFCKSIKTILTLDDQKNLFSNRNIFHLAVPNWQSEIFSTIYECLTGVFTNDEIKHLMQEKDSDGYNTFLAICRFRSLFYMGTDVLEDFFKLLKDLFDSDEVKDCLRSTSNDGSNCLLLAVTCKDESFLKELIRIIRTEISIDDQRSLIQKYHNESKNIFVRTSQNYYPGISTLISDFASKILSNDCLMNQNEQLSDCSSFVGSEIFGKSENGDSNM